MHDQPRDTGQCCAPAEKRQSADDDRVRGCGRSARLLIGGTGSARPTPSLPAGVTQAQYQAALQACRSQLPAGGGFGRGGANSAAFAAYRNCLQLHGVTLPAAGQPAAGQAAGSGQTATSGDRRHDSGGLRRPQHGGPDGSSRGAGVHEPPPDTLPALVHLDDRVDEKDQAVKKTTVIVNAVLLVLVLGVVAFGLQTVFHKSTAKASPRTATAQMGNVQATVTASGNVSSATTTAVSFATSGTLTEVDTTVGASVQAGQTLAKIDPTQAQAALTAAEDSLTAAQDNLALATSGGETPPQQAVDANSLSTAKAQVTAAQAALATAQQSATSDAAALQAAVTAAQATLSTDRAACAAEGARPPPPHPHRRRAPRPVPAQRSRPIRLRSPTPSRL